MKVAVLGAKGFIGSAILRAAERRGLTVTAVTRENYENLRGSSFDVFINANGNSKKYLSAEQPALDFDLSVASVARALTDFPSALHVHLSSIDVYPDHEHPSLNTETASIDPAELSPYGFHKFLAEQLVRAYADSWLILRMGGFVGPGLKKNSVYDLLTGGRLRVHPDSAYQYLHTDMLAPILFELVEKNVRQVVFNVAGQGLVRLRDVATWIPSAKSPLDESALPLETYDVSIDKLRQRVNLPPTRETVQRFVEHVLNGEEQLA